MWSSLTLPPGGAAGRAGVAKGPILACCMGSRAGMARRRCRSTSRNACADGKRSRFTIHSESTPFRAVCGRKEVRRTYAQCSVLSFHSGQTTSREAPSRTCEACHRGPAGSATINSLDGGQHDTQHARCSVHQATCNMQHTTCNIHRTAYNGENPRSNADSL